MKSEHRSILAVVLATAFFIGWFYIIGPMTKKEDNGAKTGSVASETIVKGEGKGEASGTDVGKPLPTGSDENEETGDPQARVPVKTWTIKNDLAEVEFSSDGGVPTSWKVLGYREGTDKGSPLIDLVQTLSGVPTPLSLRFEDGGFEFPDAPRYELVAADDTHVVFSWKSHDVEVLKTITVKRDNYTADVILEVKNLRREPMSVRPLLSWGAVNLQEKKGGGFLGFLKPASTDIKSVVVDLDGKVVRIQDRAKLASYNSNAGKVYWAGLESRYFLSAIIPRIQGEGVNLSLGSQSLPDAPEGASSVYAGVFLPKMVIPAGSNGQALYTIYSGPKEINNLKAVGVQLEGAIDYGWFTIVAVPILYLLKFFYKIIHNYGVAIILLTIFVKLLLHPINVKSLKSMKAMQQLQPRLKELQQKYKNDKQRLNQETMQLFRAHKVNPMGGCLPMLLQLPIYIALYKVLWNSIELYHAPFFWFYRDLSAPDPYLITPILLGLFMVAQQKLTPSTSADPAQQKMMMLMPVMFSVFMLFLPVGLVVYILVNTVMSVVQQYMYNRGIGFMDLVKKRWKVASVVSQK